MQTDERPGFWTQFGRNVWRVVRLLLLVAALSALTIAVVYGVGLIQEEIGRSVESINDRIAAQAQRIDGFQKDIDGLFQEDDLLDERVRTLDAETGSRLNGVERQLTGAESRLSVDLERQSEALATLEAALAALADDVEENAAAAVDLTDAASALQSDIIETNGRIDDLGGELDLLAGSMSGVDERITGDLQNLRAEFATPEEQVTEVLTALRYFRVWQLVARARLRLAENNPGLAAFDTIAALDIVDELTTSDRQAAIDLVQVRERLALAGAALPDDELAASRDLEAAWEALDRLLGLLLTPEVPASATVPEETPAEAAPITPEETPTPAPEPTATPAPPQG